jgi:hypothetical protein
MRLCSTTGCDRPHYARGMCTKHYQSWRLDHLGEMQPRYPKVCAVAHCERPSRQRGWCTKHYARWQKHGDPLTLTRRPWGTGTLSRGYMRRSKNGVTVLEHRRVYEEVIGPIPRGWWVHHMDTVRDHNNPDNLVALSPQEHGVLHHRRAGWCCHSDACSGCGRDDRPHFGHGKCRACYIRDKRREQRATLGKARY